MKPAFLNFMKSTSLPGDRKTLQQWQEESFILVVMTISIVSLPALVNSTVRAVHEGLWINILAYCISYLVCILIIFFRAIPFKIRSWTGVLVFLGLGVLSVYSTGPFGSGRVWLYTTSIFATLILGIRSGVIVLLVQISVLAGAYFLFTMKAGLWGDPDTYSPKIWITTSVTFMFLSIVCVVVMGRLIKGISFSLEKAQETSDRHQETTRLLAQRVEDYNKAILSLKESEERWHFALEGAGDGVVDWDVKRNHVFFSPRWKKMLGYEDNDIKNNIEEWFNRVHPEDSNNFNSDIHGQIKERAPSFQSRHRLLCKDGTYKWIFARGKIVQWDKDGSPWRIIGTHADISAIKQLEMQKIEYESRLQQAQKMEAIGTLAGGIAHDFNNILFPILGHAEMLMEETRENVPVQEGLKQIHASAMRARELIRQILTFSRQETTEYHPLKIQHVLKEVIQLLRSTLPQGIEIKQSIDSNCRAVNSDAIQIHQIIINLATNAYHAIGDNEGELKIGLNEVEIRPQDLKNLDVEPGPAVCLTIADTGIGIPWKIRKKIFDPFFTTKEKGKGTGMGLAVVHGIVKNMKGCINVYSEQEKGTEFKVYFPVAEKLSGEKKIKTRNQSRVMTGTERILLVDDEKAILQVETRALKKLGYQVRPMASPVEALDAFGKAPGDFDLVITDMSMPKMSGKELALGLLQIRPDIPIILCTGFSDQITDQGKKDMGVRSVVIKPVLLKELSQKIRCILDNID